MLMCHGSAWDNDSLETKNTEMFQTWSRLVVTFLLLEGPACWEFGHYRVCYHKVKFMLGLEVHTPYVLYYISCYKEA